MKLIQRSMRRGFTQLRLKGVQNCTFIPTLVAVTFMGVFFSTADAEARTPKLVPEKTFVGSAGIPPLEPDNSFPTVTVDFDEEAQLDDGSHSWTALHQGQVIPLEAQYRIGIWDGYITDVFIGHLHDGRTNKVSDLFFDRPGVDETYEGEPAPSGVTPGPVGSLLSGAHNDIGPWRAFKTLKADDLPQSEKDAIVAVCNRDANAANSYRVIHQYSAFMRVYTQPRRRKKTGFNSCFCPPRVACPCNHYAGYGDIKIHTVQGSVPINVQCDRPPPMAEIPKIADASLSIKTAGVSCPKAAKASVVIFGTGRRKVRYRIVHRISEYSSRWFVGWIEKRKILGGEGFALVAEHELQRKLGPGVKQFRLEVEDWGKTEWRSANVSCPPLETRNVTLAIAGSAEGVVCPHDVTTHIVAHTNGPGEVTLQLRRVGGAKGAAYKRIAKREGDAYIARYTIQNKARADVDTAYEAVVRDGPVSNQARLKVSCIKARSGKLTLRKAAGHACKAEALVAIHTNTGGEVPYELECGTARSWQRQVQAASSNKIGIDKVLFKVGHNEQVTCILRTRLGGELKSLGGATATFKCPALSTETDNGATSPPPLVVPVKPERQDRAKLICRGGEVRGKRCLCPARHKADRLGRTSWRCVKAEIKIRCAGGQVKAGRCRCGRGLQLRKVGANAFRCVSKPASVKCAGGKVRNGKCVCPKKRPVLVRGQCIRAAQ